MKKYKLLKDLPYVKAGAIYQLPGENHGDKYHCKEANIEDNGDYLEKRIVENNPEWFEEIKDEQKIIEFIDFDKQPCISIINPTPQTRELLRGKAVERWIDEKFIKREDFTNAVFFLDPTKSLDFNRIRIFIVIPEGK